MLTFVGGFITGIGVCMLVLVYVVKRCLKL